MLDSDSLTVEHRVPDVLPTSNNQCLISCLFAKSIAETQEICQRPHIPPSREVRIGHFTTTLRRNLIQQFGQLSRTLVRVLCNPKLWYNIGVMYDGAGIFIGPYRAHAEQSDYFREALQMAHFICKLSHSPSEEEEMQALIDNIKKDLRQIRLIAEYSANLSAQASESERRVEHFLKFE